MLNTHPPLDTANTEHERAKSVNTHKWSYCSINNYICT